MWGAVAPFIYCSSLEKTPRGWFPREPPDETAAVLLVNIHSHCAEDTTSGLAPIYFKPPSRTALRVPLTLLKFKAVRKPKPSPLAPFPENFFHRRGLWGDSSPLGVASAS